MNWAVVAAVAAGGAFGSADRYLVSVLVQRLFGTAFPWRTLSVNVIGSFVMGVIITTIALRWSVGQVGQAFLVVGILGGFTTFSAFSLDVATMVERNANAAAGGYVLGSVVLSIGALFSGMAVTWIILA